jgi:hypothetical protein
MAVPARPGPSDARVPCPLCGGLVHPIAGKCKHCKADLASYHPARPAATAPLPALLAARSGHANGHTDYAPPAFAAAEAATRAAATPTGSAGSPDPLGRMVATAREAAQPVLPPRPSYPAPPRRSAWRSWPLVVIMLAVFAIVAAIVLMVLPVSHGGPARDRKSALQPPPAPERMQTDPDVKQPRPRVAPPPTAPAQPAPAPPDPPARSPDPDSADPDLDDGSRDPMPNSLSPNGQSAQRADPDPPRGSAMAIPIAAHLCRKMAQCGTTTADAQTICDGMPDTAPPDHCPAAARCLAHIDALACRPPVRLQQMGLLLRKFHDCTEAMSC